MTTIYKLNDGKIYRSEDAATTWNNITPGTGPAGIPVTNIEFCDFQGKSGNAYFLGRYNSGAVWQSYVLKYIPSTSAHTWSNELAAAASGFGYVSEIGSVPFGVHTQNGLGESSGTRQSYGLAEVNNDVILVVGSGHDDLNAHLTAVSATNGSFIKGATTTLVDAVSGSIDTCKLISQKNGSNCVVFYTGHTLTAAGSPTLHYITVTGTSIDVGPAYRITPLTISDDMLDRGYGHIAFIEHDVGRMMLVHSYTSALGRTSAIIINVTGGSFDTKGTYAATEATFIPHGIASPSANRAVIALEKGAASTTGMYYIGATYDVAGNSATFTPVYLIGGSTGVQPSYMTIAPIGGSKVVLAFDDTTGTNPDCGIAVVTYGDNGSMSMGSIISNTIFGANPTLVQVKPISDNRFITDQDSGALRNLRIGNVDHETITHSTASTFTRGTLDQDSIVIGSAYEKLIAGYSNTGTGGTSLIPASIAQTITAGAYGMGLTIGPTNTSAYVTYSDDSSINMLRLSTADLGAQASKSLGAGTYEDASTLRYVAYPEAPLNGANDLFVWAHGNMNDPTGEAAGNVALTFSNDAASTFFVYENGWGGDLCGGLFQNYATHNVFSFRNLSTGTGAFYINKTVAAPLPFQVHYGAFYVSPAGYAVVAASGTAATQKVSVAVYPFTRWFDITKNYPNAASSNAGAITGITVAL